MAVTPSEFTRLTLAHYSDKFSLHGETPLGVDWNGAESQHANFEQLLKLLPRDGCFSLNDFGCGYGALLPLLTRRRSGVRYRGYDLNADMIRAAGERYRAHPGASFHVADRPLEEADFGLASGVFTLRLGRSDDECAAALRDGLDALDRTSRHGFAFNCLTSYSDAAKMRNYLYYPNPCEVFDWCKRRYAKDVALLHDYGLYAFTMLVRKSPAAAP